MIRYALVAALLIALPVHAGVILSGDGTETCIKGVGLGGGPCTAVPIINSGFPWEPNNPRGRNAVWISFVNTADPLAFDPRPVPYDWSNTSPLMTIHETFSADAGTTLNLEVWADDTAGIFINGIELFPPNLVLDFACADGPIGCESGEGGILAHTFTSSGLQTIDFEVFQTGGGSFGLLYTGTMTPVPEPSTFLLVGLGLGIAGVVAHRRQKKRRL